MTEKRRRPPSRLFITTSWLLVLLTLPLAGFGYMVSAVEWAWRKVTRRPAKPKDWYHPRMEDPGGL